MQETKTKGKLKKVVIKEEMVALTGDYIKAILLNQFIYWSERVNDFDLFLDEEKQRAEEEGKGLDIQKRRGWIYKSAEELSEETMLGLSPRTIRNHIKPLVDNGWLDERNNPKYRWDRTKQYRVDIVQVQLDLQMLGYALEGYPLQVAKIRYLCNPQNIPLDSAKHSNQECNKYKAIPETTTETTTKTTEKQTNNYSESAVAESRTADYKSFPTEDYIPLGQYLESQGGTNYFDPNSIEATKYYINSYRRLFNIDHPRYTKEKWSDIIDSILLIPKVDRDSGEIYISEDPYDYFEIIERIDTYFRQRFRESCNYAILHFLEPEVKWRIEQKVRCGDGN